MTREKITLNENYAEFLKNAAKSTSSSETKKLKKEEKKKKKKDQTIVYSDILLAEESRRSRTSKSNSTANSTCPSTNESSTATPTTSLERNIKRNKNKRVQVKQYQAESRSSKPNGRITRSSRRPIKLSTEISEKQTENYFASKSDTTFVNSIRSNRSYKRRPKKESFRIGRSQQSDHRHQRTIETSRGSNTNQSIRYTQRLKAGSEPKLRKESSLEGQSEQLGLKKPTRSSSSTIGSSVYRSSGSRSRSNRVGFDGAIKLYPINSEEKPRKKHFISASEVEKQRSRIETCENMEMSSEKSEPVDLYTDDEECERTRGIGITDGKVQSSYTTRKIIVWGCIICCVIIVVSIIVPITFLFGGSSDADFPQLSKAKKIEVVASISTDICNESVPKTGECTLIDSYEDRQGSELCNLVAKSMINTTVYGDIALINAGICKQNLRAPELTAGSIEEAIAAESLVVVDVSGVDVVNILTQALTATFGKSGNYQAYPYAAGLRYDVSANLPPSERVSNIEVNRGLRDDIWVPIDVRRFYKVVTTELLSKGGMGYISFGNVIDDWKDPLKIKTGDAFYNYAMKNTNNAEWSVLPNSEYSTQFFRGVNDEPIIADVPARLCHALIPGQPESPFCTAADVAHGGEVCNLLSWAIYDQNFGIDMVILKGGSCAGDIEEGNFVESSFGTVLSENQPLVTVDLLGSAIVTMIKDAVSSAVDNGVIGDYPYAAGLKFDVSTTVSLMLSNVQVLTMSGNWIPIVDAETYTVATTSDLANSLSAKDMGTTMEEQIISYAEDWKTLFRPPADKVSTQSYV